MIEIGDIIVENIARMRSLILF